MTSPVLPAALVDAVFEAIIFDMDGTLVDSSAAVVRSWTTWALEYGVTAEQLDGWDGVPAAAIVRAVLPTEQWQPAIQRINELEIADVDEIVVLPGAREALAALIETSGSAGRAAIATSSSLDLARARLGAAGLTPPSVLVTVDDVRHGKPAPDPYLLAAERLGHAPQRCLVVEDAPQGLASAQAAGCRTLAVVTTNPADALRADAVVPDLSSVTFVPGADGVRVRPAGSPASHAPDTAPHSPATP